MKNETISEYSDGQQEFTANLQKLWKKIGSHNVLALSTCAGRRVTCRRVSVLFADGKFYFQTGSEMLKYVQLTENPNAALCADNYSIEGVCRDIGKPAENDFFIKAMKKYFPLAAKRYSLLPNERTLEFTPSLIYLWNYSITGKPYMEYYDFNSRKYSRKDEAAVE